jgi:hypothetical protein
MSPRAFTLILALACAACRPVQVNEDPAARVAPSIEVRASWETTDGSRLLVGGVFCQLFQPEIDAPYRHGVTNGLEPLLFQDVAPGPYRLVVLGRDGLELAKEIQLPHRRRLTVRVDVQATLAEGDPTTRAEAAARRAIYVHEPGTDDHVEAQPVSVLEPGRMELSTEVLAAQ